MTTHRSSATALLFLSLLLALPCGAQAQQRHAAFIHGFTFGDDRPDAGETVQEVLEDKGSRWEASGTIERWKNTAIDGAILLKYFDRDLYGGARDKTLDQTRQDMMKRFVQKMTTEAPNAEWVLVGHSQGGIVARLLHEHIRQNAPGVNVQGILAIASPMQGGKPSTVAYGARSGYVNVQPEIDGFLKDVLVGPLGDTAGNLLNFVVPGLGFVFDIVANFWDPTKYAAAGVIDLAEERLKRLNEMAVNKDAKAAIGPDGTLIRKINRSPNPDAYRALLGAERAPVAPRVASGRRTEEERVVTFELGFWGRIGAELVASAPTSNLFDIFEGAEKVAPGEEPVTVRFFHDVKDAYADAADYYRYRCYWSFGVSCVAGDYRKWDRWKQGRRAIQNFGATYTEIINAYRLARRERLKRICDPDYGGRLQVEGSGVFSPPSAEEHVDAYSGSGDCRTVTETYFVTVPDETDGLLGTATNTWNPPQKGQAPNLGPHSILYNDRSSSNQYKRGGTGYNHAELVYSRRRYSSSADPGVPDAAFSEGSINPPTQNGEEFLRLQVFD
jgi:pimeloyl-ACP methyl ester carboxylesterase